jgi:hypothetical protein
MPSFRSGDLVWLRPEVVHLHNLFTEVPTSYSPKYLEVEFSEVRGYKLPRPALALYQSRRGRVTFSPLPRPYLLRLLLGSDTSCCDLLQPGLPRIPA